MSQISSRPARRSPRPPAIRDSSEMRWACLGDALLLAGAFGLNFWVWLGFVRLGHIPSEYVRLFAILVVPLVVLRLTLLAAGGLYRSRTPHLGFHELTVIALANTAATAAVVCFNLLTPWIPSLGRAFPLEAGGAHILRLPWGIVLNDWMFSLIALGGIRFLRHQYEAYLLRSRGPDACRTLIVGTGDAAARVARDLFQQTGGSHLPVGLIDPDGGNADLRIHGLKVLGGLDSLVEALNSTRADEVVIALDQPSPRVVGETLRRVPPNFPPLKLVPDLTSLMRGDVAVSALPTIGIEDLLGRSTVSLQGDVKHTGLRDRRVLITGAGGSIGAELVRQALASRPSELILIEISENNLFELLESIRSEADRAGVALRPFVGDVADSDFIERIFAGTEPEVVFHAAAHKHVHLMEAQPAEAVRNNVGGTLAIARTCVRHRVRRLVFVSTDKAVRPGGVMGATKRVGELLIGALALKEGLDFVSVRFGNVLGSRGSVLPTFRRQIERGGPVTVTDPDATRYFMTVDEAVSLLIEAGTQGERGAVLILNMGHPVRIDDLARNLIRLSGLEPGRDIEIVYSGLRPGERLTETLASPSESAEPDASGRVFVAREDAVDWRELEPRIEALMAVAAAVDDDRARSELNRIVTAFDGQSRCGAPDDRGAEADAASTDDHAVPQRSH